MKHIFAIALTFGGLASVGCNKIPAHIHTAPKLIAADGSFFTACSGIIEVYSPSRRVVSASKESYEIVFINSYGKAQDLEDVTTFRIEEPTSAINYAMPIDPGFSGFYSNGQAMAVGAVVFFGKDGDEGRAIWNGSTATEKWSPIPCK
jgi:hypothetical protein